MNRMNFDFFRTLKYAFRFLLRAKSYTIINLVGLAFSLACCIILLRYIHRELTVDTHCIDREQVYEVKVDWEGNNVLGAYTVFQDSALIDSRFIETHVVYTPLEDDFILYDNHRYGVNAIVTDSAYFKLFPYQVVQGELSLSSPESALMTESYARRIFGKENPVGKVFRFSNKKEFVVKAVLAEPENKRSLQFDLVLSSALSASWERMPLEYFRFFPGTDINALNQIGSHARPINPDTPDPRLYRFSFISVKDCYWSGMGSKEDKIYAWGERSQVQIFIGICILLLLTGLLNFVNLYMTFMLKRTHEYGIKRVFGAGRKQIFFQVYVENLLLIGLAEILAWVFVELLAVPVGKFFGYSFIYTDFDLILTLGLLFGLPLVASVYPYFKFIHVAPMTTLHVTSDGKQAIRLRMILLAFQYALAFILVVLSIYFNKQLNCMLQTEPGYRTKDIIVANLMHESRDFSTYTQEAIEARIARAKRLDDLMDSCPDIQCWNTDRTYLQASDYGVKFYNKEGKAAFLYLWYATPAFFELYDLHLVEGNIPQAEHGECYVVNRAALKALGYEHIDGATIVEDTETRNSPNAAYPIVGVIEDYYDGHISAGVRPLVFQVDSFSHGDVYQLAVYPGKVKAVLDFLKKAEKEVYGIEDFEYFMFEDKVNAMYDADRKAALIYSTFAFIAILVSCLGLFGISLFDIRQRYREIAIRKVNGAGCMDLYRLLCSKYLKVLVLSFLFATPAAWYIIYRYTSEFVVKAPVSVDIFLIALLIVSVVSLGTLLWQVNKAVRIEPAQIMKSE